MVKKVNIYTDGACKGNPGPGGWAALLRYEKSEKIVSGYEPYTTNNRMELLAAIQALDALKEACDVDIYTDSQYVQKGVTLWLPNWKKNHWRSSSNKPVKNLDLWLLLDRLIGQHTLHWHWVKGHSGHPENELVDNLANLAIKTMGNSQSCKPGK